MRSDRKERPDNIEGAPYRELRLLEEVELTPEMTQRRLASKLGVALGVANLLVRTMAKKGHIRATHLGWKRWVYIVTPAGFARKISLTLAYVDRFLDHYQRVRSLLRDELNALNLNAESRIAIYGTDELTELVYLCLRDMGVTEIEALDHNANGRRLLGVEVQSLEAMDATDYSLVMIAFPTRDESRRDSLIANGVSPSKIVTILQSGLTDLTATGGNGV